MTPLTDLLRRAGAALARHRVPIAFGVLALVVLLAVPLVATSVSPAFFGRYHDLTQDVDALQASMHAGIPCASCHADTRPPVVATLALAGEFYAGLVRPPREPRFLTFDPPRRQACLACHETAWSHDNERTMRIPHPVHLRLADETRECVECHKWTAHDEVQIEPHKEMPFSGVCVAYGCHVGFRAADECTSCHHALREGPLTWAEEHPVVARTIGINACLEACHDADQCRLCHTTGERPVFDGLRTETGLEAIERLHVRPDWTDSHGPIAFEDQAACMRCHVTDNECRSCHAHRPASHDPVETWISRHKDVVEDERRCLTCHEESWCQECHDQFKEMR